MKKCNACNEKARYYWKKSSGEMLDLCTDHYEEMERQVHRLEKDKRLANAVISVVSGREHEPIECPNGKDCKYCAEIGIQSRSV